MNTARTNHFGRRLISLLLAVMLIASLCVSGIGSFSAVTVNKAATGEDQIVYKLVDTITVGNEYLIVNTNEAGDAFALKNNGGTSGGTESIAASNPGLFINGGLITENTATGRYAHNDNKTDLRQLLSRFSSSFSLACKSPFV